MTTPPAPQDERMKRDQCYCPDTGDGTHPQDAATPVQKFLHCPFCGGTDLFRAADNINSTDRVICKTCKASAVLWKWNTRVNTHAERERLLEEAKKRLQGAFGCISHCQHVKDHDHNLGQIEIDELKAFLAKIAEARR